MKGINEISVLNYQVKKGEMKCNANEVRYLLHIIEQMNEIICGQFYGDLTEEEQKTHTSNLDYIEYFENKYLCLPALREKEKEWFNMMQDVQTKYKGLNDSEEMDSAIKMIAFCKNEYTNLKQEREQLASELDAVKEEKYSGIFF